MIRIALTGGIGSGKTFISKLFGYPVFNADEVVTKIYAKNKNVYLKLKKNLPKSCFSFPIKRRELINAILKKENNIKTISSIVHPEVRKYLKIFLKRNQKKKVVILDIPLYLENKLNKKKDIIIFIHLERKKALKIIKQRKNFNQLIFKKLENLQFPLKKKIINAHYVIKNDLDKNSTRKKVKDTLRRILK